MTKTYSYYKSALQGASFPCAILDMDRYYENADAIINKAGDKKIRIASKSIRSREAMRLLLERHNSIEGIMTYSGLETVFLAEKGFDNFLIGYPVTDKSVIEKLCVLIKKGKKICFMTDRSEHLSCLEEIGKKSNCLISICIDYDLSDDYPFLHFGVHRSNIKSIESLKLFIEALKKCTYLKLEGLMGYEAQVAGLGDTTFRNSIKNKMIQLLKKKAIGNVARKRAAAVKCIQEAGYKLLFVNGGGTGSMDSTCKEEVITEVTVGSGFFNGHFFDTYSNFSYQPALFFALEIVRKPTKEIYTCFGGGYIASGPIGNEKLPKVYLPENGILDKNEGVGEVQTPVKFKNLSDSLHLGDPIFFRHAKSGELNERFNEIITVTAKGILSSIPTYRGEGFNFG